MQPVNRTRPVTTREKAARRKDIIAGIALAVVAIAAVALTAFVWVARNA